MRQIFLSFDFAGLRFVPFQAQIEILENGKKINLSPNHCSFLMVLVENAGKNVSYEELRRTVWANERQVSERFIHNVQSTKTGLIKSFRSFGVNPDFIKSIPGIGYRLDADVKENTESLPKENDDSIKNTIPVYQQLFESPSDNFKLFTVISSLFYGLLFWIALLLEIAYEFDRYGKMAMWLGIPLILLTAGTSLSGLRWTRKAVIRGYSYALMGGSLFFFIGALLACAAMLYFLPSEPITLARFQTQPAFAAYFKDSFIYFLPLGLIFILIPFHAVCLKRFADSKASELTDIYDKTTSVSQAFLTNPRPAFLFILWLSAAAYSIYATFYLLDNLQVGKFHNLFVVLAFLRFIVYFGLAAACLLWFDSALKSSDAQRAQYLKTPAIAVSVLLFIAVGISGAASLSKNKPPHIYGVEMLTDPDPSNRQFFVRLTGEDFEPESVSVRIYGADCTTDIPCIVPNGALKKHSVITTNSITNAPLTLPSGNFRLVVQNGDLSASNIIALEVP